MTFYFLTAECKQDFIEKKYIYKKSLMDQLFVGFRVINSYQKYFLLVLIVLLK